MKQNTTRNSLIGRYIGDLVYGANDGIITTFVVVAASSGAELSSMITIILGLANLFADGLSMGVSDFLGIKSEKYYVQSVKEHELYEIKHESQKAKDEIRQVFEHRGFRGHDLDRAVDVVTSNKHAWLETMLKDEEGVIYDPHDDPKKHGFATFLAFATAGFTPLLPFILNLPGDKLIPSAIATALALFLVGSLRTLVTSVGWLRGGLEMLLIGGATSTVAYLVGFSIRTLFNVNL